MDVEMVKKINLPMRSRRGYSLHR